jgi:DNA-binding MarR family transcriptional regulator
MDTIPPQEITLWRRLCDAYVSVREQLDRDLVALADLSLSEFDVLRILNEAGGSLRMSELAEQAHASRSGLTRRVDRLERRDLVRRERVDDDRRGLRAVLTQAGERLCEEITPKYIDSLQSSALVRLNQQEISSIVGMLERIRGPLG